MLSKILGTSTPLSVSMSMGMPRPCCSGAGTSRRQPLPVRVYRVQGQGQATVGAGEDHIIDRLHFPPTDIGEGLFQGLGEAEDLRAPTSQGDVVPDFFLV